MRPTTLLAALALLALLAPACESCSERPAEAPHAEQSAQRERAADDKRPDPVVARVGEHEIRRSEVEAILEAALEGRARSDHPPGARWREQKRATILDALIEEELLGLAIESESISVSEGDLDARISREIETKWRTERSLDAHLARTGVTREAWRDKLRREAEVDVLLWGAEGDAANEPDEDDLRAFYKANQRRYRAEARVQLAAIVIRVPAGASAAELEELRGRAETVARLARRPGASFADLARQFSEGPTAGRGGALGWSRYEDLDDPIAIKAFRGAPGSVSDPIRTRLGFQILHIIDRREAGLRSFEEVRRELEVQVRHRRRAARRAEVIAQLRQRYDVVKVAP